MHTAPSTSPICAMASGRLGAAGWKKPTCSTPARLRRCASCSSAPCEVSMLTLAFTGDVMLGRYVNEMLKSITPAEMWNDLLPHLAQADLRFVNLECALTRHVQPWTRSEKMFHFRADPEAVRVLHAAGIDACALANNHTLDFGVRGLLETLRVLKANGIRQAGAATGAAEAAAPAMLDVQGTSPC